MGLGSATSKPFQVTYFDLQTPGDFIDCLTQLVAINCQGMISATRLGDGSTDWNLNITGPVLGSGVNTLACSLNDVLLWDSVVLRKISRADFQTQYQVGA